MVVLGRFFSRFSQVQSARLALKDKGFSLRALRLCVSNCNIWGNDVLDSLCSEDYGLTDPA